MPPLAFQLAGAPSGGLHRLDRTIQCDGILRIGIDLGDGDLGGRDILCDHAGRQLGPHGGGNIEPHRADQRPAGAGEGRARAAQLLHHHAVRVAAIPGDVFHHGGGTAAADRSGSQDIGSVAEIDVGAGGRVLGDGLVFHGLPGLQRGRAAGHDALVEDEADGGDERGGHQQRCQHLMGRHAGCLHRDDFAVLVQCGEGDDRRQQHRIGQEPRHQLRNAQRGIVPQVRLVIAGHAQDLAAFAEQVERLQHQHQHQQHGDDAADKQLGQIPGQRARGEKLQHQAAPARSRPNRAASLRIHLPKLAANRSSAPIGWPPGT